MLPVESEAIHISHQVLPPHRVMWTKAFPNLFSLSHYFHIFLSHNSPNAHTHTHTHTQVHLPNTTSVIQHTPTISSSPLSPITTNTSVDKTAPLSPATPLTTPTRKQSRGKGRGLAALASRASLKKRSSKSRSVRV